jgi:hypothetical protein
MPRKPSQQKAVTRRRVTRSSAIDARAMDVIRRAPVKMSDDPEEAREVRRRVDAAVNAAFAETRRRRR